mgnify:CR=1 FL=1
MQNRWVIRSGSRVARRRVAGSEWALSRLIVDSNRCMTEKDRKYEKGDKSGCSGDFLRRCHCWDSRPLIVPDITSNVSEDPAG